MDRNNLKVNYLLLSLSQELQRYRIFSASIKERVERRRSCYSENLPARREQKKLMTRTMDQTTALRLRLSNVPVSPAISWKMFFQMSSPEVAMYMLEKGLWQWQRFDRDRMIKLASTRSAYCVLGYLCIYLPHVMFRRLCGRHILQLGGAWEF